MLQVLQPPETSFDDPWHSLTERFKALFEATQTDLAELAQQRVETARVVYRDRLKSFLDGKESPAVALESAALVRHWTRTWQVEAVNRGQFEEGQKSIEDLLAAQYARLDAELLWAQARQPGK